MSTETEISKYQYYKIDKDYLHKKIQTITLIYGYEFVGSVDIITYNNTINKYFISNMFLSKEFRGVGLTIPFLSDVILMIIDEFPDDPYKLEILTHCETGNTPYEKVIENLHFKEKRELTTEYKQYQLTETGLELIILNNQ